jgi:16S rRNA (guanine966-N2)-methyltransferase
MTARGRGAGVSAGRVIAGTARGIRLVGPGDATRPLGDRVKQSLFAILELRLRASVFLDLYAGSGAAGIEALSRGASQAVFVERDPAAITAIERNVAATGFAGRGARIARSQVGTWFNSGAKDGAPFAAILIDPPYEHPDLLLDALTAVARAGPGGILAEDGVVVAKHFWKTPPPSEIGLLGSVRERRFGETTLTFLRWTGPRTDGEEDG